MWLPTMKKLLIANRGEIAIRIARAASELGIETASIYSEDDSTSLHRMKTDHAYPLKGLGPAPYLDIDQIMAIASENNCDGIHPGYGFLSENASFATSCDKHKLIFVGPTANQLSLFGNKAEARKLAASCNIQLVPGTNGDTSLVEALAFFEALDDGSPAILKAISELSTLW